MLCMYVHVCISSLKKERIRGKVYTEELSIVHLKGDL